MTQRIRGAPQRLVALTATGITRRRLVRRAGEVALGAAMAGAFLDRVATDPSYALTCWGQNGCGSECKREDCGPSPPCGDNHCRDDGECANYQEPRHHTRNRYYGDDQCRGEVQNDFSVNCWCNCFSGNVHRCCDCCQENDTGDWRRCHNCGVNNENWYRCFCRKRLCTNCC